MDYFIPTKVFPPSFPALSPHPLSVITPSTPQKGGVNKAWHSNLRQDQTPPTFIKAQQASHHREWVPKSQLMRQGQILFPLLKDPQTSKATELLLFFFNKALKFVFLFFFFLTDLSQLRILDIPPAPVSVLWHLPVSSTTELHALFYIVHFLAPLGLSPERANSSVQSVEKRLSPY